MNDSSDEIHACPRCGQQLVACFPGTFEGRPVQRRFYCDRDRLSVVVLDTGTVLEAIGDGARAAPRGRVLRLLASRLKAGRRG